MDSTCYYHSFGWYQIEVSGNIFWVLRSFHAEPWYISIAQHSFFLTIVICDQNCSTLWNYHAFRHYDKIKEIFNIFTTSKFHQVQFAHCETWPLYYETRYFIYLGCTETQIWTFWCSLLSRVYGKYSLATSMFWDCPKVDR